MSYKFWMVLNIDSGQSLGSFSTGLEASRAAEHAALKSCGGRFVVLVSMHEFIATAKAELIEHEFAPQVKS